MHAQSCRRNALRHAGPDLLQHHGLDLGRLGPQSLYLGLARLDPALQHALRRYRQRLNPRVDVLNLAEQLHSGGGGGWGEL